jgi:hypothetical protein
MRQAGQEKGSLGSCWILPLAASFSPKQANSLLPVFHIPEDIFEILSELRDLQKIYRVSGWALKDPSSCLYVVILPGTSVIPHIPQGRLTGQA